MHCFFSRAILWTCLFWVGQIWVSSATVRGQSVESTTVSDVIAEVQREISLRQNNIILIEDKLNALQSQLDDLQRHYDVLTSQMNTVEGTLNEVNVSAQAFPEVLAMLQTMRIQLKVDLAGLRAKQKLLQEASPDNSAKAAIVAQKFGIAERILELARNRLDRARQLHESGSMPSTEVDSIEVEAETAALRLLELKAELEESLNGSVAGVRTNGIELAEKEARLQEVESLLTATTKVRPEIQQMEIQRQMLNEIVTAREDLRGQISRIQLEKNTETLRLKQLQAKLEELRK